MSNVPKTSEISGQNPEPIKLLHDLDAMGTDQKKYNYLRDIFIEEADVDEYIQYLDAGEEIGLNVDEVTRLKGTMTSFMVYLRKYLEKTAKRIKRLSQENEENLDEMEDHLGEPDKEETLFKTRRRLSKAIQIIQAPRGAKAKSLAEVTEEPFFSGALSPEELDAPFANDLADELKKIDAYKSQYEELDNNSKARCSWEELRNRMLAYDSRYLRLAEDLNDKGILFGVDNEGNPLFADGGDEPVMTGMDYQDTRNRVLYKFEGSEMVKKGLFPVDTGYEMFPYSGEDDKSPEIRMFEAYTGKPFVKSSIYENEEASSWLESGKNPSSPRYAFFNRLNGNVAYVLNDPSDPHPSCGVRRLLRVKKTLY